MTVSLINKNLVITHVSKIKDDKNGKYIYINCHDNIIPNSSNETVYMMKIYLNNSILPSLIKQIGGEYLNDSLENRNVDDRVYIPTGVILNIDAQKIVSSRSNQNISFLDNVKSIKVKEFAYKQIEITVDARQIDFYDWGFVFKTEEQGYINDKYIFLNCYLPFKTSSLMDKLKIITRTDKIILKGKARIFYSTFKDEKNEDFRVKSKLYYDSRVDGTSLMSLDIKLDNLQKLYLKSLLMIKEHESFKQSCDWMINSWSQQIMSENDIIRHFEQNGISMDSSLILPIFLDNVDTKHFEYICSVDDNLEIFYYNNKEFKLILIYTKEKSILLIYDLLAKKIYLFHFKDTILKNIFTNIEKMPKDSAMKDIFIKENLHSFDFIDLDKMDIKNWFALIQRRFILHT